MNTQINKIVLERRLKIIQSHLIHCADIAVLHGSQLKEPSIGRDIDIILVVSDLSKTDSIFLMIAQLQNRFSQIIHVAPISNAVYEKNLVIQSMVENGRLLWRNPCIEALDNN